MSSKYNFCVKSRKNKKTNNEMQNNSLIKVFIKKWKKSGLAKEIRENSFHSTRNQKKRIKKKASIKRNKKNKTN